MSSPIRSDLRVVSLIASATEILDALGLRRFQVGRSHECDYPPEIRDLPVVTHPTFSVDGSSGEIDALVKARLRSAGSVYEIDQLLLEQLAPTHIVTQTQCRVCAVSMEDVELALSHSLRNRPRVIALEPNCLADIWADIRKVGSACGVPEAGESLIAGFQGRMDEISDLARGGRRPSVACIEWQEPLMAAGNWLPELVEMAGGRNLFGAPGRHSPYITWEELVAADPEVIIVSPCGFGLERTRNEMYWLTEAPEWNSLRAVRDGRVFLVDGNQYMQRPGPRVVESLQILAEILHPDRFAPELRGSAWLAYEA